MTERLHKLLARAGVASLRGAERMIEAGRISVNGKKVTRLGTRVDPEHDAIRVDGRSVALKPASPIYVMLHKPSGFVTTVSDPEDRPTVMQLVRRIKLRVYPVGRLDYHSEGLLILTNDGELARGLMHPASEVAKVYRVKVSGRPSPTALQRLRDGIRLDGRSAAADRVRRVGRPGANQWIEITIHEGRKHQVRRMCEAAGHRVMRLRRIAYAGLRLDELQSGDFRFLEPAEIEALRRAVQKRSRPRTDHP